MVNSNGLDEVKNSDYWFALLSVMEQDPRKLPVLVDLVDPATPPSRLSWLVDALPPATNVAALWRESTTALLQFMLYDLLRELVNLAATHAHDDAVHQALYRLLGTVAQHGNAKELFMETAAMLRCSDTDDDTDNNDDDGDSQGSDAEDKETPLKEPAATSRRTALITLLLQVLAKVKVRKYSTYIDDATAVVRHALSTSPSPLLSTLSDSAAARERAELGKALAAVKSEAQRLKVADQLRSLQQATLAWALASLPLGHFPQATLPEELSRWAGEYAAQSASDILPDSLTPAPSSNPADVVWSTMPLVVFVVARTPEQLASLLSPTAHQQRYLEAARHLLHYTAALQWQDKGLFLYARFLPFLAQRADLENDDDSDSAQICGSVSHSLAPFMSRCPDPSYRAHCLRLLDAYLCTPSLRVDTQLALLLRLIQDYSTSTDPADAMGAADNVAAALLGLLKDRLARSADLSATWIPRLQPLLFTLASPVYTSSTRTTPAPPTADALLSFKFGTLMSALNLLYLLIKQHRHLWLAPTLNALHREYLDPLEEILRPTLAEHHGQHSEEEKEEHESEMTAAGLVLHRIDLIRECIKEQQPE
ncbi:hypothetical protein RI367_008198 [Sorochytrium milnesiophthora]